jgi:ethanolamine ammonia-lyase small subunit
VSIERRDLRSVAAATTAARVFLDGPGTSYSTADLLQLRADHAAARDAVHATLDVDDPAFADLRTHQGLFAVDTEASSLEEYLRDPRLGRRLTGESRGTLVDRCEVDPDLQIFFGDGLSPRAVARYAPPVFAAIAERVEDVGRPFLVRRCRVGVLNAVGEVLRPVVAIVLIGERPGLAIAESMSAYLAYRPGAEHTDADRNVICNIHDRGLPPRAAAEQIVELVQRMRDRQCSGVALTSSA